MKYYYHYKIDKYNLTISEEDGYIIAINLKTEELNAIYKETSLILKTKNELVEYFNNKRTTFDIPIKLTGTEFQNKVWESMQKIPFGKTMSYQELSLKLGSKNYARAVGNACNKNKILIIIPCHRVVSKNSIGGFAYGLKMKEDLLNIETKK